MKYIKINVASSFVTLKLYIAEKKCYDALKLIRLIHELTPTGETGYSPYRGHYVNPGNNLHVTIKKVRFNWRPKKYTATILKQIEENGFAKLESLLSQYKAAA